MNPIDPELPPQLPPSFSAVAKLDPDFADFITSEYDALHKFAVRLCERFGFTRAAAEALCDQAILRGMLARRLNKPIGDEVVRAWKSTLLNFVATELQLVQPSF